MARGRPHHQASRRRTYSRRQRDIRERQLRVQTDAIRARAEPRAAIEVEDVTDADGMTPWAAAVRLPAT